MLKAYNNLTSGMYLVGTKGDKEAGCIINTFEQVAATPEMVVMALNKENYTCKEIKKSKKFNVTVLSQNIDINIISRFGFSSSEFEDKYKPYSVKHDLLNLPYIEEGMTSLFTVRVKEEIEAGTHIVFLGEVSEAVWLNDEEPLTYKYYKEVLKGKTPPKASSYQKSKIASGYKCDTCGYIYRGETLPVDYVCPICGKTHFTKITN